MTAPDGAVGPEPAGFPILWGVTWRARAACWMLDHRADIERAIVSQPAGCPPHPEMFPESRARRDERARFRGRAQEFDAAADVRSGEFSAYVDTGTSFEVRRVGDPDGEGVSGGSPVGGCMLVRLGTESAEFVGGCDVAPGDN